MNLCSLHMHEYSFVGIDTGRDSNIDMDIDIDIDRNGD